MRLVVDPRAEEELQLAVDWYRDVSVDVSVRFAAAVDEAMRRIRRSPLAAPQWGRDLDYRRQRIKAFPYALVYRVRPGEVVVMAAMHLLRGPAWLSTRFRR